MQLESKHSMLWPSFQICFQIPSWRPYATTYTRIMILSTIGEGDGQVREIILQQEGNSLGGLRHPSI